MATPSPASTPDVLSTEIRKLGRILGEIIVKLEGKDIFDLEERLRLLAKSSRAGDANAERALRDAVHQLTVSEAARMAMAFTVYFELVNLAEETHRVRLLRQRRRAHECAHLLHSNHGPKFWAETRACTSPGVTNRAVSLLLSTSAN